MKSPIIPIALIIILGFAVYANSLNGSFIWDDEFLIEDNSYIKSWNHLPKLFSKNIGAGSGQTFHFYRPVQSLTYLINHSLWKLDVRGYHFTNIVLHILTALALFWLISIIFGDSIMASAAGILFVIHPIHTEAVSYISGRADLLAAFFMLTSLSFYVISQNKKGLPAAGISMVCFALALLSRENALILPVLILLYHYSFRVKFRLAKLLPIFGISVIYIVMRFFVLDVPMPHRTLESSLLQRIPGFFMSVASYIKLLIFPFNLRMEYGNELFGMFNPQAIIGIALVAGLIFLAYKKKAAKGPVFFGICWFFITLFPHSNLYPVNAYMAEHWLYLPSAGFFLLLANVIARRAGGPTKQSQQSGLEKNRSLSLIFLIVFYSALTITQNKYWQNPKYFYERTLKYTQKSERVYSNLATIYADAGENNKAIEYYKKAIDLEPGVSKPYNSLGNLYSKTGRKNEAIKMYEKAIELNPKNAKPYNNLGNVYREIGSVEKALPLYLKAIEIYPDYIKALSNLGNTYKSLGRYEEAVNTFKKVLKINPNHAGSYNNLGVTYLNIDKRREAIDCFKKTITLDPAYAHAYNNLALIYYEEGRHDLARQQADKALALGYALDPRFLEALRKN